MRLRHPRHLILAFALTALLTDTTHAQTLPAFDATWIPLPAAGMASFVADANGDGLLDLVVDTASDTGYVIPATAPGIFGAPVPCALGAVLAVADFNGDGIADLVRATYQFGTYGVQVALGDGAFGFATSAGVGRPDYSSVFVGDATGDGRPDVIIVGADLSYATQDILLYAGRGDGTLQAPVTTPVAPGAIPLNVADMDGDGRDDVVFRSVNYANRFQVYSATPDGNFIAGAPTGIASAPLCAALADLDHDGLRDIVSVHAYSNAAAAYPYLADDEGTFTPRGGDDLQPVFVDAHSTRVACGDFDGDGALDVVTAGDPSQIQLLYGVGDGRIRHNAAEAYPAPDRASSFAVADLDGDGAAELIVTQQTGHALGVLRSPCRTMPRVPCLRAEVQRPNVRLFWRAPFPMSYTAMVYRSRNAGAWLPLGAAAVDSTTGDASYVNTAVSGDATLRYRIRVDSPRGSRVTGEITLQSGMSPCVAVPVAAGPDRLRSYEVDGDGRPDLVAFSLSGTTMSVLRGEAGGTFAPEREYMIRRFIWDAAIADFDGDGSVDVVTANRSNLGVQKLSFGYGRPGGGFERVRAQTVDGSPEWLDVADYDLDSHPDLGVSSLSGNVAILRGVGDRTFVAPRPCFSAAYPADVRSADFDEDGVLDLAIVVPGKPATLELHRGNGDGTFGLATSYRCPHDPRGVLVADLDGDHHVDVVMSEYTPDTTGVPNRAWMFRGDGHGALEPPVTFEVPNRTHDWIAADVSGDSVPDLIVPVSSFTWPAYVYEYRNLGNFTFAAPVIRYVNDGASWPFPNVVAGDFDRDGRTDLAFADAADGVVTLFYATPGVWLGVPRPPAAAAPALQLLGARPSPARASDVRLAFTLRSSSPATLELFDVQGRRVVATTIAAPAPGARTLTLPHDRALAPGVYLARLTQDAARATARVVVTR